jgi:hypothetical protein
MCSAGAPDCGVRRHTLRVEETKSECRQKVEHSCRERAHIARGTENPATPCPNPMCRHRLSRRPHQQTLFAFILLSSGGLSAPRRSCAILRQTAIGQKPGQAERQQVPRGFGSVDTPGLCRPQMQLISLSRSRTERRSCRGCAGHRQFGRRKGQADRSQSDVIMSGIVDSGR